MKRISLVAAAAVVGLMFVGASARADSGAAEPGNRTVTETTKKPRHKTKGHHGHHHKSKHRKAAPKIV